MKNEKPYTDPLNNFEKDLRKLINKHSVENLVDMPDFLIAHYICRSLHNLSFLIKRNNFYHGRRNNNGGDV
jgi:hypothetical protein